MKKLYITFIAICLIITACKKDEVNTKLDASQQKWVAFRNTNHNNYTYTAYYFSIVGNQSAETKFTIRAGKITNRSFLYIKYLGSAANPNLRDTVKNWQETANTLNTHGTEAHELLTLDQIYSTAKNVWLKADPAKNDIYFEANNDGLISSAGYVPKGCQDDCLTGIYIKDIKAL